MKKKFILIVVVCVFLFILVSSGMGMAIYNKQMIDVEIDYADEILQVINNNTERFLEKQRLLTYILQNSSSVKKIINKTSYATHNEELNDITTMQTILKNGMIGTEYLQNIEIYTEDMRHYSGTGAALEQSRFETYKAELTDDEVGFFVEPARRKYDSPKLYLIKRLSIKGVSVETFCVITINCSGLWEDYNHMIDYSSALIIWDEETGSSITENNMDIFGENQKIEAGRIITELEENNKKVIRVGNVRTVGLTADSKIAGWKYIVLIPFVQIMNQYPNMFVINAVLLIFLTLVAFLVSRVMAGKFLRNMEKLTTAVEKIDGEHMSLDIEIDSDDEIKTLFLRFSEMLNRMNDQIADIRLKEKEKRIFQQKALQAQINPHFLYNSLNTIKSIAKMQGSVSIVDAAESLSSIMQVNMSNKIYLTFEEEVDYLQKYIKMKEYQSATPIRFSFHVEEELGNCYLLKMLIQPLVENSLKHGGILNNVGGYISVSAYEEKGDVWIDVEDNGSGLDEDNIKRVMDEKEDTDHIGLYNVRNRIRIYYGAEYGVDMISEKEMFTRITLRIPKIVELRDEL